MEDDILDSDNAVMVFGRDVRKVPCFRNSWLYGISSGIGAGLLTFMFTSRIRLASHTTMGTMCFITMTYFCVCRYNHAREEILALRIKGLMQDAISMEGMSPDETADQITKLIDA